MAFTVNGLVREAYKAINLIEVNQVLSDAEQNEGIFYLNEEISKLNGNGVTIPYFSELGFTTTVNKAAYSIGPTGSDVVANRFAEVESVAITIADVQMPLHIDSRFEFVETSRLINSVQPGIPTEVWVTFNNTQTIINFYLPPNDAYPITVRGKQELNFFTANTNITTIPGYLCKYFRYALAKELAMAYPSSVWTPTLDQEFRELKELLKANNEIDVAIRTTSAFTNGGSSGYYLTPMYSGEN